MYPTPGVRGMWWNVAWQQGISNFDHATRECKEDWLCALVWWFLQPRLNTCGYWMVCSFFWLLEILTLLITLILPVASTYNSVQSSISFSVAFIFNIITSVSHLRLLLACSLLWSNTYWAPAAKTSTGFIHMASSAAIQIFYGFCGSLHILQFYIYAVALQKCDAVLSNISWELDLMNFILWWTFLWNKPWLMNFFWALSDIDTVSLQWSERIALRPASLW